jgi:hypothetical protein
MSEIQLRRRLRDARTKRDDHAEDCALWDYESNNGCLECEDHDVAVRRAGQAVRDFLDRCNPGRAQPRKAPQWLNWDGRPLKLENPS